MRILVTGATGLIGRELCKSLKSDGHTVIGLSRNPGGASGLAVNEMLKWEPQAGPPPAQALEGTDAVVHLAGEPVAEKRWNDEQKKRIRDSRVISTRNLVEGMRAAAKKPAVLVNASAVGFYGDRGDEVLDENSAPGKGFLTDVCIEWEREADRAQEFMRVVKVRTGVVLSAKGGALKKMLPPFKLGVAGPLGSGRQWFPWIHIDDIVGIYRHAITTPATSGALNGAAPGIVTNAEFTKQMGKVLHRPAFLPVPEFGLNLLFGEMATVLLASQRVVPKAALASGYVFKYPELTPALENLLRS